MKRPAFLAIFIATVLFFSAALLIAGFMGAGGEGVVPILSTLALLGVFSLYITSIIWAYSDAKRRGKPGWAIAILVAFLSWPLGLLLWYVFRPGRNDWG